jgi:hypothetical protein
LIAKGIQVVEQNNKRVREMAQLSKKFQAVI